MRFARDKEIIGTADLIEQFGYSLPTARNKISRLEKAGLLEKLGIRWAPIACHQKKINKERPLS